MKKTIIDTFSVLFEHAPFFMVLHKDDGSMKRLFAWRELIAAIFIAIISASVSSMVTTRDVSRELKIEMIAFKEMVDVLNKNTNDRISEIDKHLMRVDDQLDDHRAMSAKRYGIKE